MTSSKRSFSSALALTATLAALALSSACDEGVDYCDPDYALSLARLDASLDALVDDEPQPVALDGLSLQAPEAGVSTELVHALSHVTVSKIEHLHDHDVITIHSNSRGYLTCEGSTVVHDATLGNTDNFLWKVHDDGSKVYFERIDATGPTGIFLKMKGAGANYEVYCGEITGSGSQAAWTASTPGNFYSAGSWVRPYTGHIRHVNADTCVHVPSSGDGANGSSCAAEWTSQFTFSVWTNIAPDCVDGACACETDLDCAFESNPNYVCLGSGFCGLQI